MSSERRGRALIIAVCNFYAKAGDPRHPLTPRSGAKRDADKLFQLLTRLNYEVRLLYDLDAQEIYEAFEKESREEQGEYFLSVLSSHGEEGLIYDLYGHPIRLATIFRLLSPDRCPVLSAVPKIFFVQACRGELLDAGVEVKTETETDGAKARDDSFSHYLSIPNDTTVMFASSPGYAAYLNISGSVFLQTLCTLLEGEERELQLLKLMTRLSYKVANEFQARGRYDGNKAMPCLVSNLTREVYPFATSARTV